MGDSYFPAQTLDDVMRSVIREILDHGDRVVPTKGPMKELCGVLLELKDPLARLSRTETRGKPFSCLGELCWYLASTNDIHFISYYIPEYTRYADGDVVYGAYGPRLISWRELNQLANVTSLLKRKPNSRKAVIQLFDAPDIVEEHADIPCTCTLQFMIRRGALHLFTNMRSNDAFIGLPHDVFAFTMLQEIMARALDVDLGTYKHAVGSLHVYDEKEKDARQFLDEGWQSTISMPSMPSGDPWPAIGALLRAEAAIRTEGPFAARDMDTLDPYWADLIRLLQVYSCCRVKDLSAIEAIQGRMSSNVYHPFIDKRLSGLVDQ